MRKKISHDKHLDDIKWFSRILLKEERYDITLYSDRDIPHRPLEIHLPSLFKKRDMSVSVSSRDQSNEGIKGKDRGHKRVEGSSLTLFPKSLEDKNVL